MKTSWILILCVAMGGVGVSVAAQREAIPPALGTPEQEITALYDVRDLLPGFARDFAAPKLGESRPWRPEERTERAVPADPAIPSREREVEDARSRDERGAKNLMRVLRRHIQPSLVDAAKLECEPSGMLVAVLTPEQHKWVGGFLQRLREFDGAIHVDTRFVEGRSDVLEELGLLDRTVLGGPDALEKLGPVIQRTSECNLLSAPRITTLPGQLASLSTLEQIRYVQDWSIEKVEPGAREIAVPQIAVLSEGIALEVRVLPVEERTLCVELSVQNSKLKRPIRTSSVKIGTEARPVEIALPEVDVVRFEATVLLADGAAIIVRNPMSDPTKSLALIVSARKVAREPR